jgi:selenocysteine lyase/cysteine desulfurase
MEHNAVIRPLRGLERRGVRPGFLECGPDGFLRPETVERALDDGRRSGEGVDLVVLSHASNVCGTIQPLAEIAAVCRARGVPLVVDAAQTAGILPIRAAEWDLAALCFTGHKGLMGPQGTGGIVWRPDFAGRVEPLIEGGTGSFSHVEFQPSDMPDKFEAGTPNLPGIAGLYAAVSWLSETGIENIERRERELGQRLLDGLKRFEPPFPRSLIAGGRQTMEGRLPVFSLNFEGQDNGILADRLSREGFETRPGLHCAPLAHRVLGSFPQGGLRVSPGYFNTFEDIDAFLECCKKVIYEAGNEYERKV